MVRKSSGSVKSQSTLFFDELAEKSTFAPLISEKPVSVPPRKPKVEILRVSEINQRISQVLSSECLSNLAVTGEISAYRSQSSGHYYFTLSEKGEGSQTSTLSCVMWKYVADKYLTFPFKDGLSVTVFGYIDYYSPSGKLQFIVKNIELAAVGIAGLYLKKEEWRKQLTDEKVIPRPPEEIRVIPEYPRCIGVVTSSTGSVLHDIITVVKRRYPLPILLAPAQVQGEGAERSIIQAFNSLQGKVDLIILARGGGSFEDLFVFNHPDLVRAVRASKTPIITAIGHETDTTLVDFVGDIRAPTPSAAAEKAVPNRTVLLARVEEYREQIKSSAVRILQNNQTSLAELKQRVNPSRLSRRLDTMHQETADLADRLQASILRRLNHETEELNRLKRLVSIHTVYKLDSAKQSLLALRELICSCDPKKMLSRGYAIVRINETVVKSKTQVKAGDMISVGVVDGELTAKVETIL